LTRKEHKRDIKFVARLCGVLVVLLLLLTFNAYACVLPLQPPTQMDGSSNTEEPSRQTCDASLEIGPHSEHSSNHGIFSLHVDFDASVQLPKTVFTVSLSRQPLRSHDAPTHPSIKTTVLRI
jgi:hypothetical protein